ncbi:glutaredoxin [Lachnospiraceae bacterium NSJ-143]|nr:glutaredoxin [Lachnospiraceae bacterium NSJ-143]
MKITVIGSHLCPDTLFALNKLKEANADIDFLDISSNLPDLKVYLSVRERSPLYNTVRENGGIGIPYFSMGDGTETLDINTVLKKLN